MVGHAHTLQHPLTLVVNAVLCSKALLCDSFICFRAQLNSLVSGSNCSTSPPLLLSLLSSLLPLTLSLLSSSLPPLLLSLLSSPIPPLLSSPSSPLLSPSPLPLSLSRLPIRCKQQVDAYIAAKREDAHLSLGGDLRKINHCFKLLKVLQCVCACVCACACGHVCVWCTVCCR